MSEKQNGCSCCQGTTLIFPCSGAADVGELSDRVARRLAAEGVGKMFCLAGIGGNVSGILKTTQAADQIVVIDGCVLDCAHETLIQKGFRPATHVRITDMGFEKGQSPSTDENIRRSMEASKNLICEST